MAENHEKDVEIEPDVDFAGSEITSLEEDIAGNVSTDSMGSASDMSLFDDLESELGQALGIHGKPEKLAALNVARRNANEEASQENSPLGSAEGATNDDQAEEALSEDEPRGNHNDDQESVEAGSQGEESHPAARLDGVDDVDIREVDPREIHSDESEQGHGDVPEAEPSVDNASEDALAVEAAERGGLIDKDMSDAVSDSMDGQEESSIEEGSVSGNHKDPFAALGEPFDTSPDIAGDYLENPELEDEGSFSFEDNPQTNLLDDSNAPLLVSALGSASGAAGDGNSQSGEHAAGLNNTALSSEAQVELTDGNGQTAGVQDQGAGEGTADTAQESHNAGEDGSGDFTADQNHDNARSTNPLAVATGAGAGPIGDADSIQGKAGAIALDTVSGGGIDDLDVSSLGGFNDNEMDPSVVHRVLGAGDEAGSGSVKDNAATAASIAMNSIPQVAAAKTALKVAPYVAGALLFLLVAVSGVSSSAPGSISGSANNAIARSVVYDGQIPPIDVGSVQPGGDFIVTGEDVAPSSLAEQSEERAKFIFQNLKGFGLTDIQAAGVLGNIQVESASTFSPQIDNPDDVGLESFGIVQWRGGRRTAVEAFIKEHTGVSVNESGFKQSYLNANPTHHPLSNPKIKSTLAAQIAYIMVESYGPESSGWNQAMAGSTAAEVAVLFDRHWERSDGGAATQRSNNATALLAKFKGLPPLNDAKQIFEKSGGKAPSGQVQAGGPANLYQGGSLSGSRSPGLAAFAGCVVAQPRRGADSSQSGSGANSAQSGSSGQDKGYSGQFRHGDGMKRGSWRGYSSTWSDRPTLSLGGDLETLAMSCNKHKSKSGEVSYGNIKTTGSANITAEEYRKFIAYAEKHVGGPYIYGAAGPDAHDCSGLVKAGMISIGKDLPRVAHDQITSAPVVIHTGRRFSDAFDKMHPGDLLGWTDGSRYYHIGIYIGDGMMIHASTPERGVVREPVNEWGDAIAVVRY